MIGPKNLNYFWSKYIYRIYFNHLRKKRFNLNLLGLRTYLLIHGGPLDINAYHQQKKMRIICLSVNMKS